MARVKDKVADSGDGGLDRGTEGADLVPDLVPGSHVTDAANEGAQVDEWRVE